MIDFNNEYFKKIFNYLCTKTVIETDRSGIIKKIPCQNCENIITFQNRNCKNCNTKISVKNYRDIASIKNFPGVLIDFHIGDKKIEYHRVFDHHEHNSIKVVESATTKILDYLLELSNSSSSKFLAKDMFNDIVLNFPDEHRILTKNLFIFICHFDLDCFLGVYCLRNPKFAIENQKFFRELSLYQDVMLINEEYDTYFHLVYGVFNYLFEKYNDFEKAFEILMRDFLEIITNPDGKYKLLKNKDLKFSRRDRNKILRKSEKNLRLIKELNGFVAIYKFENLKYPSSFFRLLYEKNKLNKINEEDQIFRQNYNIPFFLKTDKLFKSKDELISEVSLSLNSFYEGFEKLDLFKFLELVEKKDRNKKLEPLKKKEEEIEILKSKQKEIEDTINFFKFFFKLDKFSEDNYNSILEKINSEDVVKNNYNNEITQLQNHIDKNLDKREKNNLKIILGSIKKKIILKKFNIEESDEIKKVIENFEKEKRTIIKNCKSIWKGKKSLVYNSKKSDLTYQDLINIIIEYINSENYFIIHENEKLSKLAA